ncbi:WD domain protein [Penicillium canariense]|uniref:WD domain protein n=1 Tax=Penicillium canariense TaxID=189055 RepID=A0A9W9IJ77_9EURO|nr:WD domain protein [Penicillium canariense]KAJ5175271.1 WD domain protein [Penicillium canariense]
MLQISKEKVAAEGQMILTDRGNFYRHGKDRTIGISFHPRADYVGFHGSGIALRVVSYLPLSRSSPTSSGRSRVAKHNPDKITALQRSQDETRTNGYWKRGALPARRLVGRGSVRDSYDSDVVEL